MREDDPFIQPLLNNRHLAQVKENLRPLRDRMTGHELFRSVKTGEQLRIFMERHVFAVYDFMCLLKGLQSRLTCVTPPWRPVSEKLIRRFVNHMVLEEETDEGADGGYASHLEMYLGAMEEAGADTDAMNRLLYELERETPFLEALDACGAPEEAIAFNKITWGFVESGQTHVIAAAFTFGREDPIPDMFRSLIAEIDADHRGKVDVLRYYLERHIHLDEDFHNPMAQLLVTRLCVENVERWRAVEATAAAAIEARIALWDATLAAVTAVETR
jgi:hypothetical protein